VPLHAHDIVQIKFDIDINNDELLENIWEYKKRRKVDHH
jgi:hypothetical protein